MTPTGKTLLQGRPYRNAASTDVRETWKRHGWTPPSEHSVQPEPKTRVRLVAGRAKP